VTFDPRRVLLTLSTAGTVLIATPITAHADSVSALAPGTAIGIQQDADANDNAAAADDQTAFIRTAVSDAATEIQAGQLARDRANSAEVRAFAERLVREHQAVIQDAATVAADNNVVAPQFPTDDDEVALIDDLSETLGDEFDETYLRAFIEDQRATIADYEAATATMDHDVAAFAERNLGTLERQLEAAQDLASRLGVEIEED
jgi:putative membrane protein